MKKKLMIFGGSGYVGSALINKLVKINKYEILNYDLDLFGSKKLPKNKILVGYFLRFHPLVLYLKKFVLPQTTLVIT